MHRILNDGYLMTDFPYPWKSSIPLEYVSENKFGLPSVEQMKRMVTET
jgi:hypothetical protein